VHVHAERDAAGRLEDIVRQPPGGRRGVALRQR
jgi:hypothetical protein